MTKKQKVISIISLMLIVFSISSFLIYKSVYKNTSDEDNVKEQEKSEDSTENEFDEEPKEDTLIDEENSNDEETKGKESQKKDDKKDTNKTENKEQTKEETGNNKSKPSSSSNYSSSNSSNSNNTSTKKPTSSSTTTKPSTENNKPSTETAKENTDEVNALRKQIENTYGITIKYGNEIGDYKPKMLKPTILDDKEKIKKELNLINNELKKYPTGFFREFSSSGMPLTIYLVSSVPGNAFSGFTDREFMSDIKITLTENYYFFEYTFNHEIMHYIDAYLEIKMYPNNPYDEYMALNPVGFNYGPPNKTYNYGNNGNLKGAYFVSDYAQSAVGEDRAEVFKNMITRVTKPAGMFDSDEVLNKKALIIDRQIRQYFKTANGTLYWDKIISK